MRKDRFAPERLLGKVVGERYRLIQILGSGGSGHVYTAERIDAPKEGEARPRVAVKMLRGEHRSRQDLVARFDREANAAARVRHENVLAIHGAPFHDGAASGAIPRAPSEPFAGLCGFAMELLVGLDLADTLASARSLNPVRATRIAAGVAAGLAAAHAAGVIHRDIKPENIFLVHAPDGREVVKLLDFGFAFLPGDPPEPDGRVFGTPEYLAPEQAGGAAAHPSGDIYSLGIVLYEMLAGHLPFTGPYPAIAHLHAAAPLPPLPLPPLGGQAIPPALEALVQRALAKHPADRFRSMDELLGALLDVF